MKSEIATTQHAGVVAAAFAAMHEALGGGRLHDAMVHREVVHLPGLLAGLEDGFAGMADLELALEQSAFSASGLRIVQGRAPLDLDVSRIALGNRIEPRMVAAVAQAGVTMVFNNTQQHCDKMHAMACRLEAWLCDPVEMVMIASFSSNSGLAAHHDIDNVLVVQLSGSKVWTLYGDPVEPGLPTSDATGDPGVARYINLQQGDAMFLPAGQRHECQAEDFSLHVGIVIHHSNGRLVEERLNKALAKDPVWLEPAPGFLGADHDRLMAQKYREHLHAMVDSLEIEKSFSQQRQSRMVQRNIRLPRPGNGPSDDTRSPD
jgi:ribosomal protein L16 Arg81 hydroxylase